MLQSRWGLEESPFHGTLDPKRYYKSPTHDEALARMNYLVENRRQLGLLLGPPGSGKTLLLEVFHRDASRQGFVVAKANLLGLSPEELEWSVAAQLGTNPRDGDSRGQVWRKITNRLVENRYQQITTLLLIDDADDASVETLSSIARMLQLDPSPDSRITAIMALDEENTGRLGQRLLGMTDLRIDLSPWQPNETAQYLDDCLDSAGCSESVFDESASTRLHELGNGIPRHVIRLAHLSLMAGAGQQLDTIDGETVESVYEELSVTP